MIRCRIRAAALAAALLALAAGGARAAVEGGPHDLVAQEYVLAGEERAPSRCSYCHLPLVGGDKFPGEDPPPSVAYFSRSGLVCYSCHDGTTMVNSNVDASRGAFHPKSHTLDAGGLQPPRAAAGGAELLVRDKKLECITCHSPHDSTVRPFLRMGIGELCVACHQGLENGGYGRDNLTGSHPVHETVEDDGGQVSPVTPRAQFMVAFPLTYPAAGARNSAGVHWRKGGHLLMGSEGTVECFTCHGVHGGEDLPPRQGLLVLPPVRAQADEFCEGCHRGRRADGGDATRFPNPGGTVTGRTYHPCDDDQSNGYGRLLAIRSQTRWPMGEGSPPAILCTTCHVAHGGLPGSPMLRRPVAAATFCEECHLPQELTSHHPVDSDPQDERRCQPPPDSLNLGFGASGGIYCYSCHVAHNAGLGRTEEDFIPILRFSSREDDICLTCHPSDNETCLEKQKGTASHFLGDPTLPETYADGAPPLREAAWPETGLKSRFGGPEGKKVICMSCHAFRVDPGSETGKPLPHFLVASAGDDLEWEADLGRYLCTGCHGDNPATKGTTGHSHPLMSANVQTLGADPITPATYTVNGKLNCESCHRAHGAVPGGGYYILEKVESENKEPKTVHPGIDFTGLCHLCHFDSKY